MCVCVCVCVCVVNTLSHKMHEDKANNTSVQKFSRRRQRCS